MNATRQVQTQILMAIATLCLLSACSKDSDRIPDHGNADSGLDTALATISRDNIQSLLNYLAADEREGRLPGTRGYDESAQYVAARFAAVGLESGGTYGWFQQVPIITRMIDIENSGVVLLQKHRRRPENRIRAEVVFCKHPGSQRFRTKLEPNNS